MNKISPHFYRYEMACKCKCGYDTVDAELLSILELIRSRIGAFTPNSVCRCVKHNESIQAAFNSSYKPFSSKSQHLVARAADIPYANPKELYDWLDEQYPSSLGIGLYPWGIHVDTRNSKSRW